MMSPHNKEFKTGCSVKALLDVYCSTTGSLIIKEGETSIVRGVHSFWLACHPNEGYLYRDRFPGSVKIDLTGMFEVIPQETKVDKDIRELEQKLNELKASRKEELNNG